MLSMIYKPGLGLNNIQYVKGEEIKSVTTFLTELMKVIRNKKSSAAAAELVKPMLNRFTNRPENEFTMPYIYFIY